MVQITTQRPYQHLIKAVEQLNAFDLQQFLLQVLMLQAQRQGAVGACHEAELLLKIQQDLPNDLHSRYQELLTKRQAETLTPTEYEELLQCTEQVEQWDAQRVEYLTELARWRGISLTQLLHELNFQPPVYV
jgi:Asp-tRNA(Asn)/Glu-tRNA(Gln) amidotransferase C subunit